MGFNPYRKFKAKPADYALVAIAVLVAVGLVVWAFAG
jgi:energy-coupling factor transporter transmembrane protein EcfT